MSTVQTKPAPSSTANQPSRKLVILELSRFIAAFYVVGIHVSQRVDSSALLFKVWRHTGQLPVMLFFVLSGFVISLRHLERKESFSTYTRARFLRIYPIYLTVLLVATVLVLSGLEIGGHAVAGQQSWADLLGNLFMVQGPDFIEAKSCVRPWAGISPFWSLSFEWWYYAAFWAIKTYLPPSQGKWLVFGAAVVGTCGLVFYNGFPLMWLMLFAVWWSGAELAREYVREGRLTLRNQLSSCLVLAWLTIINVGAYVALRHHSPIDAMRYRSMLQWTGYGLLFTVAFTLGYRFLTVSFGKMDRVFLRLGALSYALYAAHYLIVHVFILLDLKNAWLILAGVTVTCIAVADVLERWVHPALSRLLGALWPKPISAKV